MAAFLPESDSEDELPAEWEERATLSGDVYYAHHPTKTTQWTHPRTGRKKTVSGALPFGWERQVLDGGRVVFVDHENQRTTYTDPRLAFAVEADNAVDQSTFRQRFDASTTALQILHGTDLSGKVAVVTGASLGGIGFETARTLALHGCTVVFACRNLRSAEAAIEAVKKERRQAQCHALHVDLTSLRSVKHLADQLLLKFDRLDVLILNAGVFGLDHRLTPEDGLEEMFQVNYLSHFYLASLLKERMSKCLKPKIVVVSAESHRFPSADQFPPKDALFSECPAGFNSMLAYNNSKLLCLMFALEASERWHKLGIRAVAVHPGNMVSSRLTRHWWPYRLLFLLVRPFAKSLQQAASCSVFAAFAPEVSESGGVYLNSCFPCRPSEVAMDEDVRKRCWTLTKTLLLQKIRQFDDSTDAGSVM